MTALAVISDLAHVPRDGILYFWAEWSPSTAAMDAVASALQAQHSSLTILKCEAEAFPELSSKFSVEVVPTFVFIRGGAVVSRVDGANPPEIARQVLSRAAARSIAS
jgi:thioredoxin-like negative regulator of GroEL